MAERDIRKRQQKVYFGQQCEITISYFEEKAGKESNIDQYVVDWNSVLIEKSVNGIGMKEILVKMPAAIFKYAVDNKDRLLRSVDWPLQITTRSESYTRIKEFLGDYSDRFITEPRKGVKFYTNKSDIIVDIPLEQEKGKRSLIIERTKNDEIKASRPYRIVQYKIFSQSHFVGRKTEIEAIQAKLKTHLNKIFLVGMGGIGKSEIAKRYIRNYGDQYKAILFIHFKGSLALTIANDTEVCIEGFSKIDFPHISEKEYGKKKLQLLRRIAKQDTLLIIDNFDTIGDEDLEEFLSGEYSAIFTTRCRQDLPDEELEISPLEDENELLDLFCSEYKRKIKGNDKSIIFEIINLLERHTQSIVLVAKAMEMDRKLNLERMLAILKEDNDRILRDNNTIPEQIYERLKKIFDISGLTGEEVTLLKNLSLIPIDGIDVETFYEWCEFRDYSIINNLISRNWIIHDEAYDKVHLHPLIAKLMLEQVLTDPDCCKNMLSNFYETYKYDTYYYHYDHDTFSMIPSTIPFEMNERNFLFAENILKKLPITHCQRMDIYTIKILAINRKAMYQPVIEESTLLIENGSKLEHKLTGYNLQAHALLLLGEINKGITVAKTAIDAYADLDLSLLTEFERELMIQLDSRLLEGYAELYDYEAALEHESKYYNKCSNYPTYKMRIGKAWSEHRRAIILFNMGMIEEAQRIEAYLVNKVTISDIIDFKYFRAFALQIYAVILARTGRLTEGEECMNDALSILKPLLGGEHVDVAKCLHFSSKMYIYGGDKKKAIECLQMASKLYNEKGFSILHAAAQNQIIQLQKNNQTPPSLRLLDW